MNSSDGLYRFIIGIVKDRPRAQDVVQESFTRLWENRKRVESGKEKSFLFTIAYRLAISELRDDIRHQRQALNPFMTGSAQGEWDNMAEVVWQAIESLGEKQRTMIMLCDWEGYSYQEIAQITQTNEGQVKTTIHRARVVLREILKDEYQQ